MVRLLAAAAFGLSLALPTFAADKSPSPQYKSQSIVIPAASATEKTRNTVSTPAAVKYLEGGARAWAAMRNCVSCHTNGSYLFLRPSLTKQLGPPSREVREFFVSQLRTMQKTEKSVLQKGIRPTQVAYLAAGLAEWDRHVAGSLSKETDAALRLMLSLQSKDGSQGNADCWPPFESSSYQGATMAAMALAAAPAWRKSLDTKKDKDLRQRIVKLESYLKKTTPPHDYGRVLLLWTATRLPGLIDAKQKRDIVALLWKHQRPDGGWSLRTFAAPEKWGRGNRAKKLRSEPDFDNPASDGHMTGLAVLVLREAGVSAKDARLQRAVRWLRSHQRVSGRWWTRSLNTDRAHYITYSATMYAVAALAKCHALPSAAVTKPLGE